jgi:4-hydroxy-tetrahydrodipicolinate synthase
MPPDLLARLAQIDGIEGLKQSNNDEFGLIDGLAVFAGNDDILAHAMDIGAAGGICVASHLVGNEMKQMMEEADRRAEIDAELQDVYAACFCTNSPAPTKYGLSLLGLDAGGVRLPLADCDESEQETVRRALAGVGVLA